MPGRIGDLQMSGDFLDASTFAAGLLALGQFADDLLGGVLPVLHGCAVLLPQ